MMKKVKAAEGLKVFFPLDVKAGPGRRTFILEGDAVVEVNTDTRFVRRRIAAGDLTIVRTVAKRASKPKTKPKTDSPSEE